MKKQESSLGKTPVIDTLRIVLPDDILDAFQLLLLQRGIEAFSLVDIPRTVGEDIAEHGPNEL